jgi:outer membrane receptor for ferric coprogen and ferric-rhodotorulic acid
MQKRYPRRTLILALLGAVSSHLAAQPTSPTPEGASPAARQENVTVLNPFVISENDAVGYSAASTLAGTRINTALRDVGASISIITPVIPA